MLTEDDLRAVLRVAARQAPAGQPPTAASLTAGRRVHANSRRWFSMAATAAVVAAIALTFTLTLHHNQPNPAASSPVTTSRAATSSITTSRAATSSMTTRAVSGPATASPAKTGPVEITMIIDHTEVHTGQPLTGHVQITNTTGARLPLPGLGCSSSLRLLVGLSSATVKFDPPTAAVGCVKSYQLAPGTTTVPITIVNTAESGNPPAPLAAGTYQTTIILDHFPTGTVLPPPLNVTLTD